MLVTIPSHVICGEIKLTKHVVDKTIMTGLTCSVHENRNDVIIPEAKKFVWYWSALMTKGDKNGVFDKCVLRSSFQNIECVERILSNTSGSSSHYKEPEYM